MLVRPGPRHEQDVPIRPVVSNIADQVVKLCERMLGIAPPEPPRPPKTHAAPPQPAQDRSTATHSPENLRWGRGRDYRRYSLARYRISPQACVISDVPGGALSWQAEFTALLNASSFPG